MASEMMTGLIAFTRAPRAPQLITSACTRRWFAPFGYHVGDHRVGHRVPLEKGKVEQFVRRREVERLILLGRQRQQHMTGHAGDDETSAAGGDDAAELLEHQGRSVEVHCQHALGRRVIAPGTSNLNRHLEGDVEFSAYSTPDDRRCRTISEVCWIGPPGERLSATEMRSVPRPSFRITIAACVSPLTGRGHSILKFTASPLRAPVRRAGPILDPV